MNRNLEWPRSLALLSVAALAFLVGGCEAPAGQATADCNGADEHSVDIKVDESEGLLVPVQTGGQREIFGVDSGVARTEISAALARKLGLKVVATKDRVVGFHGSEPARSAIVPQLKIGGLRFANVVVHVREQSANAVHSGTIGVDILRLANARLDLGDKKLLLFHAKGAIPPSYVGRASVDFSYQGKDVLVVKASVDDIEALYVVDTGAQISLLKATSPGAQNLHERESQDAFIVAAGATMPGHVLTVSRFTLGTSTLRDEPVFIYTPEATPGSIGSSDLYRGTDGTVGRPTLLRLGAVVDFGLSKIFLPDIRTGDR